MVQCFYCQEEKEGLFQVTIQFPEELASFTLEFIKLISMLEAHISALNDLCLLTPSIPEFLGGDAAEFFSTVCLFCLNRILRLSQTMF